MPTNTSHTVNITRRITTRTTVTSSNMGIGLNTQYFKSIPGILCLVEVLLGILVVGLAAGSPYYYGGYGYGYGYGWSAISTRELMLLVVASAFLITSAIMYICNLIHEPTADVLPTTLFEVFYHIAACVLYFIGAIAELVVVHEYHYGGSRYSQLVVAGIFALVECALYIGSAILSFKKFKK